MTSLPAARRCWRPLAEALLACHRGERDVRIEVRDDRGGREHLSADLFFRTPERFSALEREALRLCGARVVDVGAGAGPHALALQDAGHEVLATESLPELVALLRARGVRRVVRGGVEVAPPGKADSVLLMMNGLGLAGTLDGLTPFLVAARDALASGGTIVADSTDLRDPESPADRFGPDGRYLGELQFQLEFRGERGEPFGFLYVDPDTLAEHASAAGLAVEAVRRFEAGTFLAVMRRDGERQSGTGDRP